MKSLLTVSILIFFAYFLTKLDASSIGHKSVHTNWVKLDNASLIICQNEFQRIQCSNYEGIYIIDSFWGRNSNVICQSDKLDDKCSHTETCIPANSKKDDKRVKEACHGYQDCWLAASNIFFRSEEDLCPNVCKYLQVNYACKQMSGMK